MRLLGRYIFREILTSSLLGALLASFIIFLNKADALFKVLVGTSPPPATVVKLLALALPPVLPFTIPFGVLIGILIGLGRMSADGEIVAMRAAGVPSGKVIAPVLLFACLGMGLAAWASLRLTPYAFHETARIMTDLIANKVSAAVQERVFIEDFQNTILYVDHVVPSPPGIACGALEEDPDRRCHSALSSEKKGTAGKSRRSLDHRRARRRRHRRS